MGTRILTFHRTEPIGNEVRMSPSAHYIEADYTPIAVRIASETVPVRDAKIDILDDGVSIFNNRRPTDYNITTGADQTGSAIRYAVLSAGEQYEEQAEDFASKVIASGSWVTCNLVDAGGVKNIAVHLELFSEDEAQENE